MTAITDVRLDSRRDSAGCGASESRLACVQRAGRAIAGGAPKFARRVRFRPSGRFDGDRLERREISPLHGGLAPVLDNGTWYVRLAADCADDVNPAMPAPRPVAGRQLARARDVRHVWHQVHRASDLRRILMWDGYPYFPCGRSFRLRTGDRASRPGRRGRNWRRG